MTIILTEAIQQFVRYQESLEKSPETLKAYRNDLHEFLYFINNGYPTITKTDEVTADLLHKYLSYLKADKQLQPASRNRYLSSVRTFFQEQERLERITKNPMTWVPSVKVPDKRKDVLSQEELTTLLSNIDHPVIYMFLLFLSKTGLRISEAINIKLRDVNLTDRNIQVYRKGGRVQILPLAQSLIPCLEEYLKYTRPKATPYLFGTERTGRLSSSYINLILRQTIKRLGWTKHISAHSLRRSFATNLYLLNIDLITIQRLLNHKSLRTTQIYIQTADQRLYDAVDIL
jgi:site-specific recombinase XerD